jgi:hypothetical protein
MMPSSVRPKSRSRPQHPAARPDSSADGRTRLLAVTGILAVSCAQFLFLTVGCDWDLCGDEAEFWAWSRRLDWGYFARGPLIALVIRLGTGLFGSASLAMTGSMMPAVRLPAVVLSALTAWGIFRLGSETCRSSRIGLFAVLILPAVPLFRIGGLLMTCDMPLVCCWTWAAVWSYRAILRDDPRAWLLAGIWTALGVLAKYTMLAFPASVGLYLMLDPNHRKLLFRPGFWALAASCLIGMAPVIYWNSQHGWVAAGQLADRMGFVSSKGWLHIVRLLTFLAGEIGALLLWGVLGLIAIGRALTRIISDVQQTRLITDRARTVVHHGRRDRPDLLFLVCLWAVVWSACVVVSLRGETEMNWSAPGEVAGMVLIAWMLRSWFAPSGDEVVRPRRVWAFAAFWVSSMLGLTVFQHSEWVYPLVARLVPEPTTENPTPFRKIDPTGRMRGYHDVAPAVEERLKTLRAEGLDPFVLAPTYALTSLLSFYLPGQPEVYCLSWSPGLAARVVNQHDLWHPNPRHDLGAFRDRPAVVVEDADRPPGFAHKMAELGVFRKAGETSRVVVRRRGIIVGAWDITVCYGYRGPQNVETIRKYLDAFASTSYFAAHGGTAEGYVRGLYRDILDQTPTPRDVAFWSDVLMTQPSELVVVEFLKCRGLQPRARP